MTIFIITVWLFLLICLLLLLSKSSKRPPSYNGKGRSFSLVFDAVDFLADPIEFIHTATRKCGNIFSLRILTTYNVWLRGNTLNKQYLYTREDVWSFAGGMGIFLDRLVDDGFWINYKVLLASVSRYINRSAAQIFASRVTVQETERHASEWAASGKEIKLFNASSALVHGIIVRAMMGEDFYQHNAEELFHLLHAMEADIGSPLNFILPEWVPHPAARRLERARLRMKAIFSERFLEREISESTPTTTSAMEDYIAFTLRDKLTAPLKDLMPSHHTLILFAAHTSTAASIAWNIIALLQRPEIMRQVTHQLRSGDSTEHPLLLACIKETSRFYCGMKLLRLARQDVQLPGSRYVIPKGSFVSISPYLTHHDPENFEDPDAWLPERWLPDFPEREGGGTKSTSEFNSARFGDGVGYMPFGAGSHRCVGEKLAMIMVTDALVTLLRHWDVEWADEGVPGRTDFGDMNFDKIGSPWLRGDVGVRFKLA